MTTPQRDSIHLDDPGQLIAAVPGLLTFFPPAGSLVLVTFTGGETLRLRGALRTDLPEPDRIPDLVRQLRIAATNHGASAVETLIVGGGGDARPPRRLPRRRLVERLAGAFEEDGIALTHATWVPRIERGMTWWCYEAGECTGQVGDPDISPVTAAVTADGTVVFASREELAGSLAADPADVLARRAELLNAVRGGDPGAERALDLVRDTVEGSADAEPALDDETVVRLAHALSNQDVREACLAYALTGHARAAERLWAALTRSTPGPERAEPASLLAVCAYLRGEGTLAGLATDIALADVPDHHLALSMRLVLDYAVPPHGLEAMLAESFARAAFDKR
jgi:hypothetical protein